MRVGICLSAIVSVFAFGTAAHAALINVDIDVTGAGGPAGTFTGTGVLGGGTWNSVSHARVGSPGTTVPATALVDSTGGSSGASIAVATFNNSYDVGNVAAIDTTFQPLMSDYLYLNGSQAQATITLSGLGASSHWDLVLYGANGNAEGSKFTIGGTSLTTSDTGTITGLNSGDEYVRFNNVVSDGSGIISITWDKTGTSSAFNGLQLVSVPEPGSFAMLLFGGTMLWAARRKRG